MREVSRQNLLADALAITSGSAVGWFLIGTAGMAALGLLVLASFVMPLVPCLISRSAPIRAGALAAGCTGLASIVRIVMKYPGGESYVLGRALVVVGAAVLSLSVSLPISFARRGGAGTSATAMVGGLVLGLLVVLALLMWVR